MSYLSTVFCYTWFSTSDSAQPVKTTVTIFKGSLEGKAALEAQTQLYATLQTARS